MAKQRTGRPVGRPATPKEPLPPCPVCGGPKRRADAVQCRSCWRGVTADRNASIAADWRTGTWTKAALAAKHGLSVHRISKLLTRAGAVLPDDVRKAREAARGAALGRLGIGGRPAFWPDCPERLRGEYMRLRRSQGYTATEARRILEENER